LNLTYPASVDSPEIVFSPLKAEAFEPHEITALAPDFSKPLGQHIVVELEKADANLLADLDFVKKHLIEAAHAAGVTIMTQHFATVPVGPNRTGVSGALILAESHFTIHTDPEKGYAALDLFTCGGHTDPRRAFNLLIKAFKAHTVRYQEYQRGFLDPAAQKMFHGPARLRSSSVTHPSPLILQAA